MKQKACRWQDLHSFAATPKRIGGANPLTPTSPAVALCESGLFFKCRFVNLFSMSKESGLRRARPDFKNVIVPFSYAKLVWVSDEMKRQPKA
jgi:hypothetical protein